MNNQIAKISIVEDTPEVRESLKNKINSTDDLVCIGAYEDGYEALQGIPKKLPDIVLMDIGLPFISGIECMLRLKVKHPEIQFLMFTVFDDDDNIFEALKVGADGYVLKKDGVPGVLNAIRELLQGGSPMSRSIAKRIIQSFHRLGPEEAGTEQLTPRQIEILNLLAQGLLYKEIGEKLNPIVTEGSVKQHVNRIYKKLHVNNRTEALNKFLGKT